MYTESPPSLATIYTRVVNTRNHSKNTEHDFGRWSARNVVDALDISLGKIIFHQDNASTHKSVLTMTKFYELRYELLDRIYQI